MPWGYFLCSIVSRETMPAILRLQHFILRDKFSTVSTVSTKIFNNQTKFSTGFQQVFNRFSTDIPEFSTDFQQQTENFQQVVENWKKYNGTLIKQRKT